MRIYRYGLILLGVLCLASFANAQGGIGDPAVAPGSPATSYALNGIDHINYYNGLLNTAIPILTIGGRGSASRTITIPIQRQWSANTVAGVTTPLSNTRMPLSFSYTFGAISAVTVNGDPYACTDNGRYLAAGPFLTYLIWHGSDGTESILWDTKSNGQPKGEGLTQCDQIFSYQQFDRERTFRSADGSNLVFIADQDVIDQQTGDFVTGTLITKDGLHFKITTDSYASQIEDRNGNVISTQPQVTSNGGAYTITDPVGRATTINYTLNTIGQDVITYPGYNGNSRIIRINYTLLQNVATEPLETPHSLFPELNGATSSTPFNPSVISSIVLADNSQYTMQYNAYGELAKLTLPTGGYYTYSYWEAHGSPNGDASGVITLANNSGYRIVRPLRERDEYADGVNLSAKLVLTYPSGADTDPNHTGRLTSAAIADFEDANGNILRKEIHDFYGNPLSTAAPSTDPAATADWWEGLEFKTYIADGNFSVKRTEQRVYGQQPCGSGETCWYTPSDDSAPAHDPQLCQTLTTLDNGQAAGTLWAYDQYSNLTDKWEYGYGSAPAIGASCPSSPGSFYRHTKTQYVTGAYTDPSVNLVSLPTLVTVDQGGSVATQTRYGYDESDIPPILQIPQHDDAKYSGNGTRGNLTSVSQCSNAPSCTAWVTQTMKYDTFGNATSSFDGKNHETQYGYNDDPNNLNTYARVTSITNVAGQKTVNYYDTGTGKLRYSTDPNGVTAAYEYNDGLDRLTHMDRAGTHTNYIYSGTNKVTQYQMQTANWDMPTETDYDGFGRAVVSKTYEDPNNAIATYTTYNALGLVATVSNPMRAGDALNVTTYSYDPLKRLVFVTTPDNAVTSYSYSGPVTTVADPANKLKQYTYDSLGRLLTVVEDPAGLQNSNSPPLNLQTNYSYDLLDNLYSVTQGAQTRVFNHDSLGRLTSAANPESGTVSYDYDNANNLLHKTDARGVVTTYSYDALNRVIDIGYSDGTPPVHYSYDQSSGSNAGIGRLTSIANVNSTVSLTYDALGRVITSQQDTNGEAYNFSYGYNAAGTLTSETYPSGRVLTMGYDTVDRQTGVSGNFGGAATNYAASATYAAHGGLAQVNFGNGLQENYQYNNRLQLYSWWSQRGGDQNHALLWLALNYTSPSANNGNLQSVDEYNGGLPQYANYLHFTQHYYYDGANRFFYGYEDGASCPAAGNYACWFRTYDYDAVGNRWLAANGGLPVQTATPTSNIYNANNRMTTVSYDAAGNQLAIGGTALTYDAENRQASATNPPQYGGGTANYRYDGLGQRVEMAANSRLTVYVYDAFGGLAAEYNNFAATTPACTTCYLTHDQLGSTRMVTDQAGNLISRHDFLPFGEEIQAGTVGRDNYFGQQDFVKQLFTGQTRDQETGLDFFNARYMSAPQGRFLSADPFNAGANLTDPQTWNAYGYVRNNPLNLVDPSGMGDQGLTFSSTTILCKWWQVWCWANGSGFESGGTDNGDDYDFWLFPSASNAEAQQQPQPQPKKIGKVFTCASEFAAKYSIAGGLQRFGIGTSGVGGFITNALGGNAFSGATDLIQSFGGGEAGGHNVFYNMGQGLAAGPTQGFGAAFGNRIEGTPWASGPSDVATAAIARAAFPVMTGAGQTIQTLNGAAKLGSIGMDAGEFATGVGAAKFGYDLLSYGAGLFGCAAGVVH